MTETAVMDVLEVLFGFACIGAMSLVLVVLCAVGPLMKSVSLEDEDDAPSNPLP